MTDIIRSKTNPGGLLAVTPSGNIIAIASRLTDAELAAGARPALKAGFAWATADDLALAAKIEADRAKAESAAALASEARIKAEQDKADAKSAGPIKTNKVAAKAGE